MNEQCGHAGAGGDRRALELARKFSTDESVAFVNGVLDAVSRDAA